MLNRYGKHGLLGRFSWLNLIDRGFFSSFVTVRFALSILIISAMALHAASRLGALTYLYQNKGRMAYALGLVSERPITECSSSYFFADRLTVTDEAERSHENPLPVAHEIHLFFVDAILLSNNVLPYVSTFPVAQATPSLSEGAEAALLRPPIFA